MKGPADVTGQELFKSLSVDGVQKINEISNVKTFKAGQNIFKANQEAKNIYILLNGLVVLRFPGKKEAFSAGLVRIEKNDLIGAGALLGSPRYLSEAHCVKKSTVLAIDGKKLREILEEDRIVGFDVVMKIADLYFERYVNIMKKIQSIFV
jgi:CRP-like cAMP-binding protein